MNARRRLAVAAALCALPAARVAVAAGGFRLQTPTALPLTPEHWSFDVFSNGDLLAVRRRGLNGRVEITVLAASGNYQRVILLAETALPDVDAAWDFIALPNRDVMVVKRQGDSGQTEVHVLDGGKRYAAFRSQLATALPAADRRWAFGVNGDGDLVCINRLSAQGRTEVMVLDGSRRFGSFRLQTDTALHATDRNWSFGVLPNGDVAAITRQGASGRCELHVLDASRRYGAFRVQVPLPLADGSPAWHFAVRANGEVYGVLTRDSGSGRTEVHVIDGRF